MQFIGNHFFNPAEKMPLVEVVRLPATDPDAIAAAVALARRMGKTPVVVADTPGFIVNRILMPYLAGAMDLLSRGLGVAAMSSAVITRRAEGRYVAATRRASSGVVPEGRVPPGRYR